MVFIVSLFNESLFDVLQLLFTRSCLSSFRQLTHGSDSHKNEDSTDSSSAPEGPHEIYKGALATQVKGVKTFSFGTSLLGIGMQPMLYEVFNF